MVFTGTRHRTGVPFMPCSAATVSAEPGSTDRPGKIDRVTTVSSGPLRQRRQSETRTGADALYPSTIVETIAVRRISDPDVGTQAPAIERERSIEPGARIIDPPANPPPQAGAEAGSTGRIAHDLNNLFGVITLNLELARERVAREGD